MVANHRKAEAEEQRRWFRRLARFPERRSLLPSVKEDDDGLPDDAA
jgi:hypothetical protein